MVRVKPAEIESIKIEFIQIVEKSYPDLIEFLFTYPHIKTELNVQRGNEGNLVKLVNGANIKLLKELEVYPRKEISEIEAITEQLIFTVDLSPECEFPHFPTLNVSSLTLSLPLEKLNEFYENIKENKYLKDLTIEYVP